jgi:hydrogenase maturation protease
VVERLRREPLPGVEAEAVGRPIDVLNSLDGCRVLVLVDACRTGAMPGTVQRFRWPDGRLQTGGGASTHGFGLADVLVLANNLGRLPPRVTVLGMEAGTCEPGGEVSSLVEAGLAELYRQVLAEVGDAQARPGGLCGCENGFAGTDG